MEYTDADGQDNTETPRTLADMVRETACVKAPCDPPAIDPELQFKWGLALLGKEKAAEYLAWLRARFGADAREE